MKRAIEESFPIVEINRLAIPERNAFKPIYKMHKWFARRASCVFRAILLAAMKPAGTDIMEEFYKNHTEDPDTNGVKILDPFMGGGTTVVEALRLGCHVKGIDLNPVAWFVVKTEVELVEIKELEEAFERLAQRKTASGKSVKEELLSHYNTDCPCCGQEADIIYTFWVKSAICTNPTCKKQVPLFKDYIIAQKSPSTRYIPDYQCPHCKKKFDLDTETASLIAQTFLTMENPFDSAGEKRGNKRWTVVDNFSGKAECPWCSKTFEPKAAKDKKVKKSRKKVPLTVLLCPDCHSVWQMRGTLSETVSCPSCGLIYDPSVGQANAGKFVCRSCGNKDAVIKSVRKLPEDQLLPTKPYAIKGFCTNCIKSKGDKQIDFLQQPTQVNQSPVHKCKLAHVNGTFFDRVKPTDLKRINEAEATWNILREELPYPNSRVPYGEKTKTHLIAHHYRYWHQLFNPRQLLCLSTLLQAIGEEPVQQCKELLLSAFFNLLNNMSDYCSYIWQRDCIRQIFARHDFHPKATMCESTVWGTSVGMGTFSSLFDAVLRGKAFNYEPFDRAIDQDGRLKKFISEETILGVEESCSIKCEDAKNLAHDSTYDLVITDPPYSSNVNYSELSDYFYAWLRLILSKSYSCFSPEVAPKAEEIVENPTRNKSSEDYREGLKKVWSKCSDYLKNEGILAFTFHHARISTWEALLASLCEADFVIEAVYPIHGDTESSLHLIDKQSISYDLIHVCKKRNGQKGKKRSWAGVRQEIRKKAREEIKLIESGRYGEGQLSAADTNIILIGKCLELYSKHYGNIVDYKDEVVPLRAALASIRLMVEMLVNTENPLPSELENVDPVSYVYLTCLCDRKEVKSDEVHKTTRGFIEPEALFKAGVIRKGRAKRGRTYEVKLPDERLKDLEKIFGKKDRYAGGQAFLFPELEQEWFDNVRLVDVVHYLMALAITGENITPWLRTFNPVIVPVRVAMEYMMQRNPTFQEPVQKVVNLIEV